MGAFQEEAIRRSQEISARSNEGERRPARGNSRSLGRRTHGAGRKGPGHSHVEESAGYRSGYQARPQAHGRDSQEAEGRARKVVTSFRASVANNGPR